VFVIHKLLTFFVMMAAVIAVAAAVSAAVSGFMGMAMKGMPCMKGKMHEMKGMRHHWEEKWPEAKAGMHEGEGEDRPGGCPP
jgi:hypothetical protein